MAIIMQIKFQSKFTALAIALAIQLVGHASTSAQNVKIHYQSTDGTASVSPITIPNPDTGIDITITPTATITEGGFTTRFSSDADGHILGGYAAVTDLIFSGQADIGLASSIPVFGFPVSVTASLSGPISVTQVSPSVGRLEESTFVESSAGLFNVTFGPLECTDSAFGVFCSVIENGLDVEFPLAPVSVEAAPLPFAGGTFADLNVDGGSTATSQISFSIPLGPDNSIDADVSFAWSETAREFVVPEPTPTPLLLFGVFCFAMKVRVAC